MVDAVPVHFLGGLWGLISVGLFSKPELTRQVTGKSQHPGFFYSLSEGHNDARLLACQVLGILFILGWTAVTMFPFFLALNHVGWLRTQAVEEIVGLDVCYNDMGQELDESEEEKGFRDEFLQAYEEYKLKNTNNKKHGGSDVNSQARSYASSNGVDT